MAGVRFPLFVKIIIWFFLNLIILGAILLAFFSLNFRFSPNSRFAGIFNSNIESVTRQITNEADGKTRLERDAILRKYAEKYDGVEFFLFNADGNQMGGREISLPPKVSEEIIQEDKPPPPPPADADGRPNPPPNFARGMAPPPPSMYVSSPPSMYVRTIDPTTYWFGARIALSDKADSEIVRARLLAASDSFYGYGLFFNPMPWLILTSIIILVSILFWLPFVRNMTTVVGKITEATEQIAKENFSVRVGEKRTDELGRLGASINHLAIRLAGFVGGQKRFLGDISHELNSPLARMNFALTILEDRVDEKNRAYVEDVKEEVELMAKLVGELLTYSKTGMQTAAVALESVKLRPLVERVAELETAHETADIEIDIPGKIDVLAQPELISRALSNIIRNGVRYAGNAGTITVSASRATNKTVEINVSDKGAGVPENELEKIFDPLYRVESHRSRQTGGTGLGLAIVKTCVEACQGKVFARNVQPHGLEITIILYASEPTA